MAEKAAPIPVGYDIDGLPNTDEWDQQAWDEGVPSEPVEPEPAKP